MVEQNKLITESSADDFFLEKDTVAALRSLNEDEVLLLETNYYKGVKLNGYYSKGDTPKPIQYYLSNTVEADNGGSIFAISDIKLEHDFNKRLHISYFGALGDGVTNNFTIFQTIASFLTSGYMVDFEGNANYLVSHELPYIGNPVAGVAAFQITSLDNITINGNKCSITCINHDLDLYTGLAMFLFQGCSNLNISEFTFDMSFLGRNNSASYYPRCGAIIGQNLSGRDNGDVTTEGLSHNIYISGNIFDLYHPQGAYGEALNPTPGDPNNGFKVLSCYFHGDHLATLKEFQNNTITFTNNIFTRTHNAFGVWIWAYNNVTINNNKAYAWCNWASAATGGWKGGSYQPMVRYHQFYCDGFNVFNNFMSSRPHAERIGAYKGRACFLHCTTNISSVSATNSNGLCNIYDNSIQIDTDDLVGLFNVTGVLNVNNNIIRSPGIVVKPIDIFHIYTYEGGVAWYTFENNKTDDKLEAPCLVRVENGGSTKDTRRVKTLVIKNNIYNNSYGFTVLFYNRDSRAFTGVNKTFIEGNIADATASSFTTVNSAFVDAQAVNVATDEIIIQNNKVYNFYYFSRTSPTGDIPNIINIDNYTNDVNVSTEYCYLPLNRQRPAITIYTEGTIPYVGNNSGSIFLFYWARLINNSTNAVENITSGRAHGATRVFGSKYVVPVGYNVEVTGIIVARKNSLNTI